MSNIKNFKQFNESVVNESQETVGSIIDGTVNKDYYGQGMIYKNWDAFESKSDEICYVPELTDSDSTEEGYKFADFLELANGDESLARTIFDLCDWQHPSTVKDELEIEGEI